MFLTMIQIKSKNMESILVSINPTGVGLIVYELFLDGNFSQKNGSGVLKFLDFFYFIINLQIFNKNLFSKCFLVISKVWAQIQLNTNLIICIRILELFSQERNNKIS